jgi:hypothetical protein
MLKLPVIFRIETRGSFKGQVTAYFPTCCGTTDPTTVSCYATVGQHGSADESWLREGRPARPEEYADLLKELQGVYSIDDPGDPNDQPIELVVCKRATKAMRAERFSDYEKVRNSAALFRVPS